MEIIDLHTHTFYSDGVLSPSELVYRYKTRGCKAIALTDHIDYSNIEFTIKAIKKVAPKLKEHYDIEVIVGAELTYIPPPDIKSMTKYARKLGAEIVLVHGETTAEQVPEGTNMAAVNACCDILAHPGHLSDEVADLARINDVFIELTTRFGHGDTNKEVFFTANKNKCSIVLNTDTHKPEDLLDYIKVNRVMNHCGLAQACYINFYNSSARLVEKIKGRR